MRLCKLLPPLSAGIASGACFSPSLTPVCENHGEILFLVPEKPGLLYFGDVENVVTDLVSFFIRVARKPGIQIQFKLLVSAQAPLVCVLCI